MTYPDTGLTSVARAFKGTGAAWEQKQEKTYFDTGALKQRTNYDGANTVIEQHTLSYIDGTGWCMNGTL